LRFFLFNNYQFYLFVKIIRKQVEKYDELVKEQAERMERAKRNSEEVERLRKEAETVKGK